MPEGVDFLDKFRNLASADTAYGDINFGKLNVRIHARQHFVDLLEKMKEDFGFDNGPILFSIRIYLIEDQSVFESLGNELEKLNKSRINGILPEKYSDGYVRIVGTSSAWLISDLFEGDVFIIAKKRSSAGNEVLLRTTLSNVLLLCGEVFYIHASCVNYRQKGILFLGEPGSGKSTFVIGFLSRGGKFVSDDKTYVKLPNLAMPNYRHFKLNMGTLFYYPELRRLLSPQIAEKYRGFTPERLWKLGSADEIYVHVEEIFGSSIRDDKSRIDYVIMPTISPDVETVEIEECEDIGGLMSKADKNSLPYMYPYSEDGYLHTLPYGLKWAERLDPKKLKGEVLSAWKKLLCDSRVCKVRSGLNPAAAIEQLELML